MQACPSGRARRRGGRARQCTIISGCSQTTKGQYRTTKTHSILSHCHDHALPRQHMLICTGAEPIHLVHGSLRLRATKMILRNRIHNSAIFVRFLQSVRAWAIKWKLKQDGQLVTTIQDSRARKMDTIIVIYQ